MTTGDAKRTAAQRYPNWLKLLRDELRLLGNPKTIAVGSVLTDQLQQLGFTPDCHIPHYSWSGSRWMKVAYQNLRPQPPLTDFDGLEPKLRSFSDQLMRHIGYTDEIRRSRLTEN